MTTIAYERPPGKIKLELIMKAKVDKQGNFTLPLATVNHCTNIHYVKTPSNFNRDARRLINRNNSFDKFFLRGKFNINNLPAEITYSEKRFITEFTIVLESE